MPRITNESAGRYYTEAHGGVRFEPDETKDVGEEAAEWLLDRSGFVRVDSDDETQNGEPSIDAALGETIDELEDKLIAGGYDDRLDELEAAERESKGRTGALDAIAARRDELAEE